ncbi:MAG: peptide chain release factor N(5)-glutamine methyltransferase [Chitinophagales bacterium]
MTIQEAERKLIESLNNIYETRESIAIADLAMEYLLDWKKFDRIINKSTVLSPNQESRFEKISTELLSHRPVQYVTGTAWFSGLKLFVDEQVLIPRPETEELVEWILDDQKRTRKSKARILDIGTGSGSIGIALKRKWPAADISACDVSEAALNVARKNAENLTAEIHFLHLDFLKAEERVDLPIFDILVSNPPYIPFSELKNIEPHVATYEPHLALFVDSGRPFVFYEAIAEFAMTHLAEQGSIYAELHVDGAAKVKALFLERGFGQIELRKDMQGLNRMIKATRLL